MKTDNQKTKRGRPKSTNPKKQVFLYIEQSVIDYHGGMVAIKKYLTQTAYVMVWHPIEKIIPFKDKLAAKMKEE